MKSIYTAKVTIGVTRLPPTAPTTTEQKTRQRLDEEMFGPDEDMIIYSVASEWVGCIGNSGGFGEENLSDDRHERKRTLEQIMAATRKPERFIAVGTKFDDYVGSEDATEDMLENKWIELSRVSD